MSVEERGYAPESMSIVCCCYKPDCPECAEEVAKDNVIEAALAWSKPTDVRDGGHYGDKVPTGFAECERLEAAVDALRKIRAKPA